MSPVQFLRIFGHNLKTLLDESCMSQKELATKLGISESTLSRYINGNYMPNLLTVVNLMNVLECEFDDLVYIPSEII